jgi:hypothetical protein
MQQLLDNYVFSTSDCGKSAVAQPWTKIVRVLLLVTLTGCSCVAALADSVVWTEIYGKQPEAQKAPPDSSHGAILSLGLVAGNESRTLMFSSTMSVAPSAPTTRATMASQRPALEFPATEPGTLALLGTGMVGVAIVAKRTYQKLRVNTTS